MDRRTFLFSGGVLLLAPALMSADDFTGKWSGSFVITSSDGDKKDDMAFMDLKQKGAELTGTAGESPEKQWAIQNGKVEGDRKSTRLNSSHLGISYAVFCLKKKKT